MDLLEKSAAVIDDNQKVRSITSHTPSAIYLRALFSCWILLVDGHVSNTRKIGVTAIPESWIIFEFLTNPRMLSESEYIKELKIHVIFV
jgi:hypothetical protein